MPFKVIELVKKVSEISDKLYYERKRKKKQEERGSKNFMAIQKAKELLIKYKNMTEPEAHKYLQISSMKTEKPLSIRQKRFVCYMVVRNKYRWRIV